MSLLCHWIVSVQLRYVGNSNIYQYEIGTKWFVYTHT